MMKCDVPAHMHAYVPLDTCKGVCDDIQAVTYCAIIRICFLYGQLLQL